MCCYFLKWHSANLTQWMRLPHLPESREQPCPLNQSKINPSLPIEQKEMIPHWKEAPTPTRLPQVSLLSPLHNSILSMLNLLGAVKKIAGEVIPLSQNRNLIYTTWFLLRGDTKISIRERSEGFGQSWWNPTNVRERQKVASVTEKWVNQRIAPKN